MHSANANMRYLLYGNTSSNISAEECGYVNQYTNFTEKCLFVQNNTECQDTDGYINYVETLYCTFEGGKQWEGIVLYVLWLLMLFVGLGIAADDFLVPNLETISKMLRYTCLKSIFHSVNSFINLTRHQNINVSFIGCHQILPE